MKEGRRRGVKFCRQGPEADRHCERVENVATFVVQRGAHDLLSGACSHRLMILVCASDGRLAEVKEFGFMLCSLPVVFQ
jgi:hypothetical protein